jgi:hypothetical protein
MADLGAIGWLHGDCRQLRTGRFVAAYTLNNSGNTISGDATTTGDVQYRGAKVSLVRLFSREQVDVKLTSTVDGSFSFENIPPGSYEIVITGQGVVRSKVFGPWTF